MLFDALVDNRHPALFQADCIRQMSVPEIIMAARKLVYHNQGPALRRILDAAAHYGNVILVGCTTALVSACKRGNAGSVAPFLERLDMTSYAARPLLVAALEDDNARLTQDIVQACEESARPALVKHLLDHELRMRHRHSVCAVW
jgi:hypothetical protein